jgi:hypothetical protein
VKTPQLLLDSVPPRVYRRELTRTLRGVRRDVIRKFIAPIDKPPFGSMVERVIQALILNLLFYAIAKVSKDQVNLGTLRDVESDIGLVAIDKQREKVILQDDFRLVTFKRLKDVRGPKGIDAHAHIVQCVWAA